MLHRGSSVIFLFSLYSIGNAGQSPQLAPPVIVPQPQETAPLPIPSAGSPEVVKPQEINPIVPIPDTVKPEVSTENVVKPEEVKLKAVNPADIASPESSSKATPAAPILAPQPENNIVELLPHRATYRITLDKNYYDEDVADAKGEMTIQLAKAGDGWVIEQKSTLHIYYKDETAEQVITSLATYESLDGLKYSFNARTLRGEEEEIISGEAILASKGGAGIVTYQQPDESEVRLPVGTIFPTQHLIYMLQAAKRGQKVVSNIVFDGSSETHEAVQVDTVLGASQEPKLALTNKDLFQAKKVWPMRMAIYTVDSNTPEADYEIMQHVLDHGVIRDMTLDYGTFKVKAVLTQVEVFLKDYPAYGEHSLIKRPH